MNILESPINKKVKVILTGKVGVVKKYFRQEGKPTQYEVLIDGLPTWIEKSKCVFEEEL